MEKVTRPAVDEYFLKIASVVAERSTCRRHHVGAVAVKNKHILATGYNGAASGLKDCLELGCLRDELKIPSGERHEVCRGIHAEQNVIVQASLHGVSLEGSTIYCNSFEELFREAGIKVDVKERPPSRISYLD
jgi:dCMP deaminase